MGDVTDLAGKLAQKEFSALKAEYAKQVETMADILRTDAAEIRDAADLPGFADVAHDIAEMLTEASETWSQLWEALRHIKPK